MRLIKAIVLTLAFMTAVSLSVLFAPLLALEIIRHPVMVAGGIFLLLFCFVVKIVYDEVR